MSNRIYSWCGALFDVGNRRSGFVGGERAIGAVCVELIARPVTVSVSLTVSVAAVPVTGPVAVSEARGGRRAR